MRKNHTNRAFLATPEGVQWWEDQMGLSPTDAAQKLGAPIRTYFRWKEIGLPNRFHKSLILDRMEAALPRAKRG